MQIKWQTDLPDELRSTGYADATGELAWTKEQALRVVDYLTSHALRILGVEVWIPKGQNPSIPGFFGDERASEFVGPVELHNDISRRFISDFSWPPEEAKLRGKIP